MEGDIRYARSGDLSIAYQVVGGGPPDLVFVPGFVSHMEKYWDLPAAAQIMRRFARRCRFVGFDKRGTGLSDRFLGTGSIEERADDLRAVMDADGIERAPVVGLSEGGPMALLFAASYPERVSSLVLWATFAGGPEPGQGPVPMAGSVDEIESAWGSGAVMPWFIQNLPDDPETVRLMASFERNACTPHAAVELLALATQIDIRSVLPTIQVPTLVVHRTGDPVVPCSAGRSLAAAIPGAELVELAGATHIDGVPGGDDDVVDAILDFVCGAAAPAPATVDRVLATVLFTDIVDSTRRAAAMGDEAWTQVLEDHDRVGRMEIDRHQGRLVKSTGDGLLATFDGPARAVRAGRAIIDRARGLGLEVRAGLHTGEVELRGQDIAGIGVHVGARVGALAGAGEVLVSSTVKDLVLGSGLAFEPRGTHELKGVPGEWSVFAAVA